MHVTMAEEEEVKTYSGLIVSIRDGLADEMARLLPRGHAIYKGHALRIQRPVITVVEKAGDVASVGKDLLTRWGAAPAS